MMISTHNDLPEDVRRKEVDFLNKRLAESIDLVYQAKQAHWNVKGMEFRSFHKLFDKVAHTVDEYVDQFAERLVQLGGVAEGTVQATVKNTSLEEYPLSVLDGVEHLLLVCQRVAQFGKNIREGIRFCSDLEDQDTADIFTDASKDIDELTWMLEAHLFKKEQVEQEGPIDLEEQKKARRASSA